MPNWAMTDYRIVGNKEDCDKVYEELKVIEGIQSVAPSYMPSGMWYLNAYIYPEHYTLKDLDPIPGEPTKYYPLDDARGSINEVYEPYENAHGHWVVQVFAEEAWGPHFEIMHYYAKSRNCTMCYYCEESGNCIYEMCDPCGIFGDDEFVIDDYAESSITAFSFSELFNEGEPAFLNYISGGRFYKWCQENNKEITKDTLISLAEEYTDNLPEDDKNEYDIYIYAIERVEHLIDALPENPPAYNPPTTDNN